MNSIGADYADSGSGCFPYGRWMRGGAVAVGGQILLLSYVIGFGLSVFDAVVVPVEETTALPTRRSVKRRRPRWGAHIPAGAGAAGRELGMRTAHRRLACRRWRSGYLATGPCSAGRRRPR